MSTPHLSITNAGIMHSGQYYCVVSNDGGRATSNHTQLVISESSVSVHVNILILFYENNNISTSIAMS